MRNRKFEHLIDDYLLGILTLEERKKLEKHYFCSPCSFRKILEREEIISVVKNRGNIIFQDLEGIDRGTENSSHSDQEMDVPSPAEAMTNRIKVERIKKMDKKYFRPTNKEKEILAIIGNNPEGITLPEIAYLMGEAFVTIIPAARRLTKKGVIKKKDYKYFSA